MRDRLQGLVKTVWNISRFPKICQHDESKVYLLWSLWIAGIFVSSMKGVSSRPTAMKVRKSPHIHRLQIRQRYQFLGNDWSRGNANAILAWDFFKLYFQRQ